ncbi:5-hydroxytryptamine receptor-like isoform X2 [Bradysia coprophila]|uniref:5-hydroxytryptamine receptor-like isoform X2 n=1 Tax=Bradysia coprophila TaxID=38358 RepID=UPI00187D9B50|nr:5-hydroxytryptamine receptor-like isoform X2 [Bradysia coprophila]
MDRIFGSWWPFNWGRQETQTNFVSPTSIPSSSSTTTVASETTTISPTTSLSSSTAASTFATRSAATISNAFYTLFNTTLDIFNGTTIDPFTNDSLLETNDFTEDELFGMLWTNGTDFDLEFKRNSTNATSGTSDIKIETTWQLFSMIATAVILAFIILATVIGNVFVIAAILLERNLQSVANYLILSLAVADLLVACLVMPLSAVYEVSQEWKLGPELCDMWTSSDVLCCTSSILHLVAIAIDRYWAVTNIDYVHHRTAGRIGIMILVVWSLSLLVSIAPLLGWKDPKWYDRVNLQYECMVSQDITYQIFATASSFYVPLFVILVLYWRIFQTARKRIRRRQQGKSIVQLMPKAFVSSSQAAQQGLIASAAGGSGGIAACVVTVIGRPLPTISETTTAFTNISSANTSPEKCSYNGVDRIEADAITTDNASMPYPAPVMKSTIRKKAQNSADSKRERKAAKTLAIITGAFVCCWLPFFISAILLPSCPSFTISPVLMSLFLWLGYFNSTLNPIIYTIFSPEFRHAFKRILCGRKNNIRRRTGVMRR